MTKQTAMEKTFAELQGVSKDVLLFQVNAPAIHFDTFSVCHKNDLWLVLFFRESWKDGEFDNRMEAAVFYDRDLHLLWAAGIKPISGTAADGSYPDTVNGWYQMYGRPHGMFGEMDPVLQYLTDDGCIFFVSYEDERVDTVAKVPLSELEEHMK